MSSTLFHLILISAEWFCEIVFHLILIRAEWFIGLVNILEIGSE